MYIEYQEPNAIILLKTTKIAYVPDFQVQARITDPI